VRGGGIDGALVLDRLTRAIVGPLVTLPRPSRRRDDDEADDIDAGTPAVVRSSTHRRQ